MNESKSQNEPLVNISDQRCEAIRAELEATRAAFHALMARNAKAKWRQKSPSCAWTVGEVLFHLTWALEYLPQEVEKARRGQGMFNLPRRLSDKFSYWITRSGTWRATPEGILRRYDRAMDASIQLLETITTDDWLKGANFYGEGFYTIEGLFHVPAHHLAEHTPGL